MIFYGFLVAQNGGFPRFDEVLRHVEKEFERLECSI